MDEELDLNDFLRQLEAVRAMGSLSQLVERLPGLSPYLESADITNESLETIEAIVRAMTPEQRAQPSSLLGPSAYHVRSEIAARAETEEEEVEGFLEQFDQVRQMLRKLGPDRSPEAIVEAAHALYGDPVLQAADSEDPLMDDQTGASAQTMSERLDELLDKIQEGGGVGALTVRERAELERISAELRRRRG